MISFLPLLFSLIALSAEVSITCHPKYDDLEIPHLKLLTEEEFYYCFGYQHGSDRAWQMDYFRRVAQGKNAEVLGLDHLKNDLMMRLLDLPKLAQKIWTEFPVEKKLLLEFYSRGVNAGLITGKNSKEFLDKGYEPEEWKPVDSLTVLLLQSFDQTRRTFWMDYHEELSRGEWGERAPELFSHENVPWANTILKEGEYKKAPEIQRKSSQNQKELKQFWASFPSLFGEESGSNNWVVSKKKSKTGNAILANDPHLDLLTPIFWYWIHLKSPQAEVIGASLPGLPLVVSGTNGKVAWGLTNAYINTADVFFVKVPDEEIESVRPTVWFKWGPLKLPFFFKSFQKTKSGFPFLPLDIESDKPMVLRWSGFSLDPHDITPMFELGGVSDVTQMDELFKKVGLPSWNFVYADTKGDIGFRVIGKSYRHTKKTPFGIPTLAYKDLSTEEFLSPEERPSVLKPKREYVYTANNRHWPSDAVFYGGRGYSPSFRGFRIDELLTGKHDRDSFKAIQCDEQVVDARFFLPKIFQHITSPILANWDKQARDGSQELSLYRRFMDLMMEKWKVNEYALYRLLDTLKPKMRKEMQELYTQALQDVDGRPWGNLHRLNFPHLSRNEEWNFSPEIAGVGDNHTVTPGTSRWNEEKKRYQQISGASMRMIIEMKERPTIELSLPGRNRDYTEKSDASPWIKWKNCEFEQVSF